MTRRDSERGAALVETILLGLLLLVPLMWALGVLADLQRSALATTAAAREAGFEAARSTERGDAARAVDRAVAQAFRDQDLDPSSALVEVSLPGGLARGAPVEIEVGVRVPIFQAPLIGRVAGPSIVVTARHVARVDPYRSRP
jgi:hypothetical protein